MLSLTTASTIATYDINLGYPALTRRALFVLSVPEPCTRRRGRRRRASTLGFEFGGLSGFCFRETVVGRCGREWQDAGRDSGFDLEGEILEFMRGSENPDRFPTRRQLVEAGRMDLAEAIMERGGWLSLGWDLDGEDVKSAAPRRVDEENGVVHPECVCCDGDDACVEYAPDLSFELSRLSAEVDNDGIEGILNRLEKERNMTFGVGLRVNGSHGHMPNHSIRLSQDSADLAVADQERSHGLVYINGHSRDHMSQPMMFSKADVSKNSLQQGISWRTWTSERLGSSNSEFEAAEIDFNANHTSHNHEMEKFRLETSDSSNREAEEISDGLITHNELKGRLRHLQSQLSSVLAMLRSKSEASEIEQEPTRSSDSLQKYYDAWEFQENEIMAAKDMLRSIRAKMSVLEGKMAFATSDAQKIVEERQKKIDAAHRALQYLRTTCVVWPNHANEVLLAGSFDGWTGQRRMERSSTGIFSLYLKLYPGKYEIKFIVDGVWKIDPLRPIVNNNGYENNLLIVT
ncbi:hypothetical protein MLD38_030262 [Melastoma candidum]|uniref:Uncharacterized protein n=1 Tax=Melastoma candidum TaxID=119954 RepID=A0ACB9MKQ0_9MYRT|nr:hypothetical protein MLD38_030262 [Melastoma candidum]